MKRQTREGDEIQVGQLVDWIRKEKIWGREHGRDRDFEAVGALDDYRHLLSWMQGAMLHPDPGQGESNRGRRTGSTGRVWELALGGSAMS
jgi:hypothetical protein